MLWEINKRMTHLNLVTSLHSLSPEKKTNVPDKFLLIETWRNIFLVSILIGALFIQISQTEFINLEVWVPFYTLLFCSFLFNALYLHFFDYGINRHHEWFHASLFGFDALFITVLIYFTGSSQSVFLFLYLVNIVLCGLVFRRKGSLILALCTSILFSFVMIIGPSMQGKALYIAVGMNNMAFFTVAFLGGLLSEQLNLMGHELVARQKDIVALKDLNQMIVDNMATGLFTTGLDGIISQANLSAMQILEDRQLSGKSIYQLFPSLQSNVNLIDFFRNETIKNRYEVDYKNLNGEHAIIELTLGPMRNSEKVAIGYVFTFQDLTQIKKMEFAFRQKEKMAAVGQLAAGIAHEIRNPLASISGSIQLLSDSLTSYSQEDKKLMKIVLREIDRLNNLISEFLDYVRPAVRIEEPINLNQLLSEIVEFLRNGTILKSSVHMDLELKSGRLILGHKDKLRQALLNILINSYQALDKIEQPKIRIETMDINIENKVKLVIADNGCGMDEYNLNRMFEPFHTTKVNGTGLGLAITHKILENHGAVVHVTSALNKGTEFNIEFFSPDEMGNKPPKLRIA